MTAIAGSERSRWLLQRFSGIELLIVLVAFFVSLPFTAGGLTHSILLSIVLVSAAVAITGRRRMLIIATLLAALALAGRWINYYRPDLLPPEFFLTSAILLVLFVIANLLRFVLSAPSVNTDVLCSSISAYLLLSLAWTLAYWLVAEINPNAFAFNISAAGDKSMTGFNGLYFSIVTLTTLGYGDITPISKLARMLAGMEAMTGLLYVAVLIARLVAIHAAPKTDDTGPRA